MRVPLEQSREWSPDPTTLPPLVLRQLCQIAERSTALYRSDDWQFVCDSLSDQSRAEIAQALRTVAYIAQKMAESLEVEANPHNN